MKMRTLLVLTTLILALCGASSAHYDGHRYEYKYQQYLPYAINARKFGKAYDDISAIVHHYGLEIPKSSPICGVSNVCYYCRMALAKEKPFEETETGKKCLMALDDAHYGFNSLLDQYDYYYLSSYSKDKVDAYVDTDDLKKDDLKNEYDFVVKKLKALLALACTKGCGRHEVDPTASGYCSACVNPDSTQCQLQIRRLCQAGYSRRYFSASHKYTTNFLWYSLGSDAPKYCEDYLGYSSDESSKLEAKCAILDAIVGQCEKERHSKPCPYEWRGDYKWYGIDYDDAPYNNQFRGTWSSPTAEYGDRSEYPDLYDKGKYDDIHYDPWRDDYKEYGSWGYDDYSYGKGYNDGDPWQGGGVDEYYNDPYYYRKGGDYGYNGKGGTLDQYYKDPYYYGKGYDYGYQDQGGAEDQYYKDPYYYGEGKGYGDPRKGSGGDQYYKDRYDYGNSYDYGETGQGGAANQYYKYPYGQRYEYENLGRGGVDDEYYQDPYYYGWDDNYKKPSYYGTDSGGDD